MKKYVRLMLGRKSVYANECFEGNFIGADFGIDEDLTGKLPEEWRSFNKVFIPIYLEARPDKTKIGAGLACSDAEHRVFPISDRLQVGERVRRKRIIFLYRLIHKTSYNSP